MKTETEVSICDRTLQKLTDLSSQFSPRIQIYIKKLNRLNTGESFSVITYVYISKHFGKKTRLRLNFFQHTSRRLDKCTCM